VKPIAAWIRMSNGKRGSAGIEAAANDLQVIEQAKLRDLERVHYLDQFGAGCPFADGCKPLCTLAGRTSMAKTDTSSLGPKGPGTSCLTGGRLWRYAAIASASILVNCA